MTVSVTVGGREYGITPVGGLARRDRRELMRAKDHRERAQELRTIVRIQVPELPPGVLGSLGHEELNRIEAACDAATLADVQAIVANASDVTETRGDAQARDKMARVRESVDGVAKEIEGRDA